MALQVGEKTEQVVCQPIRVVEEGRVSKALGLEHTNMLRQVLLKEGEARLGEDSLVAAPHEERRHLEVAQLFGLEQVIEIGHMAGRSNVVCWLKQRDVEPAEPLVDAIFSVAKRGNRNLTDDEVWAVVNEHRV